MITKLELIEYLKHTPENTNYNILRSGLYNGSNKEAVDEFIEALSRGNLSLAALQPYLAKLYEDDKTISPDPLPPFSSGGASVPKPLTYDYMPEGYPTKSVQTTTLMEEQALAFSSAGKGAYAAQLTNAFEIVEGQTYTVKWDGTEYECVGAVFNSMPLLGNLSIMGAGGDTGEPFIYAYVTAEAEAVGQFGTLDTSASHTISVKRIVETVTPMAEEFLPTAAFITHNSNTGALSSNLTNDELYERLLGGKQVVMHNIVENEYFYLRKWKKDSSGRIDLAFSGETYDEMSLYPDGTIGWSPVA